MKYVITIIFIVTSFLANAQKGELAVSVGANGQIPKTKSYIYQLGTTINASYGISKNSNIILNYSTFQHAFIGNWKPKTVSLGYQHFFDKKKHFYVIGELGVTSIPYTRVPTVALGIGYQAHLSSRISIFAETKYSYLKRNDYHESWWTASAGIKCKLGKLR